MTIRRLAVLAAVALAFLAAAVALAIAADRAPSGTDVTTLGPAPAEPAVRPEPTPMPTATPSPTPTPVAAPVEPPSLIAIPEDLIATPTPDGASAAELPVLSTIPNTPRDRTVVYLTFDDGPDPIYTNQVLDVLARYNAKATFFVIGVSVDAYPAVAQRIAAEGHTFGNHTYLHEALPLESPERVMETLGATNAALNRATGTGSSCVRPPYGSLDEATFQTIRNQGYTVHMWDVDSEDWRSNDSAAIADLVLSTLSLGDRVLFHDGPSNRVATVDALETVLASLAPHGVQFHALPC